MPRKQVKCASFVVLAWLFMSENDISTGFDFPKKLGHFCPIYYSILSMGELPRFLVQPHEDFSITYQQLIQRVEEQEAVAIRAIGAAIETAILLCQKAIAERRIEYLRISTFSFYSLDRIPVLIPGLILEVQLVDARRPKKTTEHQGKNESKYMSKSNETRNYVGR